MEVEHNLYEIFEISTDDVEQEGTDNESAATNAVAEFKNMKHPLSGESGIPRGDLSCFYVQEILGEDQVEVVMYNNDVTENADEEFMEVTEEISNASDKKTIARITGNNMEEMNDFIVTFGKETDDKLLFEENEKRFHAGTCSEENESKRKENIPSPTENGDAAIENDKDQCRNLTSLKCCLKELSWEIPGK